MTSLRVKETVVWGVHTRTACQGLSGRLLRVPFEISPLRDGGCRFSLSSLLFLLNKYPQEVW